MLFNSFTFIFIFLPIVLILYFLNKNIIYRNAVILLSSILFYAWGEPVYIILLLFSTLVNYVLGIILNKKNSKSILIIGILINVSILGFYKYINFIINNLNQLFNLDFNNLDLVLPLGISFYTFQSIAYLIDIYLQKISIEKNIFNFSLYMFFFPKVLQGPIEPYQNFAIFIKERKSNLDDIINGIKRFIFGLGKKVIIANQIAIIADTIFNGQHGTVLIWLAAIAYTIQIYFDFSGYTDMALGIAQIFGFKLSENFNYPYISQSVSDFWRRWHMSLGSWFRNYIYIPLGGNRVPIIRFICNILVVWLLTGLWHGAAWNFIFWGIYYGIILLFEKIFINKLLVRTPRLIKWFYSIIIIIIGWVIFSNPLHNALSFIKTMFIYKPENVVNFVLNNSDILIALPYLIIGIIGSTPIVNNFYLKINKSSRWAEIITSTYTLIIYLLSLIFLVSSTYNPFIYFRF